MKNKLWNLVRIIIELIPVVYLIGISNIVDTKRDLIYLKFIAISHERK